MKADIISKIFLKIPTFFYIGARDESQDLIFTPHHHKDLCEMTMLLNGSGIIKVNGKTFSVEENSIIIFNPNVIHEEYYKPRNGALKLQYCTVSNFQLHNKAYSQILEDDMCPVIQLNSHQTRELADLLNKIDCEMQRQEPGYSVLSSGYLMEFMILLLRKCNEIYHLFDAMDGEDFIEDTKQYIDSNYTSGALNLENLGDNIHLNPYYLAHMFKQETGMSPMKYVQAKKLEKAKNMLATTNDAVKDIAITVGYNDVKHFFKIFKKYTGLTPSEYRKSSKNS